MTNLLRTLSAVCFAILVSGCTSPKGVAWSDYYFGAADAQKEAELVCMRYPNHYPNCDVARLLTLAEATDLSGDNRCTDFTERATGLAQDWGIKNLAYVFIPGDNTIGRDAHVALLVSTPEGKYVVDNGSVDSPYFYRTGTLEEFAASVDGDVVEIQREFTGAEAQKYQVPVTVMDAVLPAKWNVAAAYR